MFFGRITCRSRIVWFSGAFVQAEEKSARACGALHRPELVQDYACCKFWKPFIFAPVLCLQTLFGDSNVEPPLVCHADSCGQDYLCMGLVRQYRITSVGAFVVGLLCFFKKAHGLCGFIFAWFEAASSERLWQRERWSDNASG